MKPENIIGKRYGRLEVLSFYKTIKDKGHYICRCDCGNIKTIQRTSLISGSTKSCGCLNAEVVKQNKIENILGQKFGRLEVISFSDSRKGIAHWACRCDCGKVKIVSGISIRGGNTKSCGCLQSESIRNVCIKRFGVVDEDSAFKALYAMYKGHAKRRNIDFGITKEEAEKLFIGDCFYCGELPNKIIKSRRKEGKDFIYNGVDRIDSSKGYFSENCVPCCTSCNKAKLQMSVLEFKEWVAK